MTDTDRERRKQRENGWTPGPWAKAQTVGSTCIWDANYNDSKHSLLISIEYSNHDEADARLIAAAPEMAELLRMIAEGRHRTDSEPPCDESKGIYDYCSCLQDRADELLARIHGEAP